MGLAMWSNNQKQPKTSPSPRCITISNCTTVGYNCGGIETLITSVFPLDGAARTLIVFKWTQRNRSSEPFELFCTNASIHANGTKNITFSVVKRKTRNSAIADKSRDAFRGQLTESTSPNIIQYVRYGFQLMCYSNFVPQIFDFKNVVTLKSVSGHSRSLKVVPFDKRMVYYYCL